MSRFPIVSSQLGIWFADQVASRRNQYVIAHAIEIRGALDPELLCAAIATGVAEADTVTARYFEDETGIWQDVSESVPAGSNPAPEFFNLSGSPDPSAAAWDLVQDDLRRELGIGSASPLYRHVVMALGTKDAPHWLWFQRYHHLMLDGYSFTALTRRIAEIYSARLAGQQEGSSPFGSVAAVVAEYETYRESDACQRDRDFWRAYCADMPASAALSFRAARPPAEDAGPVAVHLHSLPAETLDALEHLAAANTLAVFDLLMAAVTAYLHHLSGEGSQVIGVPFMRRMGSAAIASTAPVVNVLPVRIDIDANRSLLSLADRVKAALRDVRRHQRYDAEQIQRDLGLVNTGRPLYGPVVNYRMFDYELRFGSTSGITHHLATGPVDDIEFGIKIHDGVITLELRGAANLYDEADLARHSRRLAGLIDVFLAGPEQPVSDLPIVEEREQRLIAEASIGPQVTRPDGLSSILDVFNAQAEQTPDATALVFAGTSLSFSALSSEINRLARYLIAQGAGPGEVIAVALPRSEQAVIAMLAVLASGAAYLPVDLDYPAERLADMCEDANPRAVLTQRGTGGLPATLARIDLDEASVRAAIAAKPPLAVTDADRTAALKADAVAYVIFTSGSTGRPKGVMSSHSSLLNLLLAHLHTIYQPGLDGFRLRHAGRALRAAHTHSFAFDSSWLQIFWMLLGQELHVIDDDMRRDADRLAEAVDGRKIDALDLPPSFCTQVMACGLMASGRHHPTVLLIGGEAITPALWSALSAHPELNAHNLYGPTEFTVDALRAPIGCAPYPVIGRPIGNGRAHVLDDRLRPVPVGVIGELYLSGSGMARGYLGRPELTAQRFVANPFHSGEVMYRTGDRVRWNEAGQIEFLGRVDHQVKVRGYRIETSEVEGALEGLSGVRAALVVAEAVNASHRLIGYCTMETGRGGDKAWIAAALRQALGEKLPEYMVPAAIVVLDQFPLTVNGKVDRTRLPPPSIAVEEAASTPAEKLVCEVMAEVLKMPVIGVANDFFFAGGDSISAIMLCSALRARGFALKPRDVFSERDARRMALRLAPLGQPAEISQHVELVSAEETATLERRYGPIAEILPMLATQKGMLFHVELADRSAAYNAFTRLTLRGKLDAARLRHAFDAVLRRHPQLGGVFDLEGREEPLFIVPSYAKTAAGLWPWRSHDISHLPLQERGPALARIEALETERGHFGPGFGRLLSVVLVKLDAATHVLLVIVHHLMIDGWSTPLLLSDLFDAYRRGTNNLPPLVVSYGKVVRQLSRRDIAASRSIWAATLDKVTPTRLFDHVVPTAVVEESEFMLSEALTEALLARAKARGITLSALMQAVWAAVIGSMAGRNDVVFGTPVAGRSAPVDGLTDQIGLFLNTIPVRVSLQPHLSLWDQAEALQTRHALLMEHDGLGLGEIQSLAGAGNLFDTLLVVENYPDHAYLGQDLGGLRIEGIHNRGYSHYPLTLLVLPGERITLLVENRGAVADADALAARVATLLETLATAPDTRLAALPMATAAELQRIEAINDTDHPLPPLTLRDLLLAQAARSPDAIALIDAEHRLTFGEVRHQVLALAARLRTQGVGAGDVVAVALPRSARLSIALLAVIETGAAFLPLDLSYPPERLAFMIEDAAPRLVVTDGSAQALLGDAVPAILFDRLSDPESDVSGSDRPPLSPEDPAYILYTSGTTGRPKGAVITHKAIVNRLLWMQHEYPLGAEDVVLQKTPCGFDVSVWEFFWSFIVGARLVMAPPDAHRDPAALAELIESHGVTTLHFVPSMLAIFIASVKEMHAADQQNRCRSLRRVFCSGEALARGLSRDFADLFGAELHNLYGPTEAAIDVSYAPATGDLIAGGGSVPIGMPVWNTRLRILDHQLRPVPPGVPGELYLLGVQLGLGYLGRPELTATRFVADPFEHGARMYRTGDLARWLPDGKVEYLGRTDHQIKIRGQRVELGEIEAQIERLPGVRQAVVLALQLGQAGMAGADERQLVAYVVPAPGASPDLTGFATVLKAVLPAHMVPAAFLLLEDLPLSPNGKLDRKALPRPDLASASALAGRPPAAGLESLIAAIFADLLGRETVGADEDFFAIGGHSLLAMRLAARIRRDLKRQVSVGQIMIMPTVARLAEHLVAGELVGDMARSGFEPVIRLRDGEGPPLICIYPASGVSWQYSVLSRYLRQDMPIIGLQSPRPHGPIATSATMEEIWDRQLEILRQVQPKGPYYLLGYSLGGTIAYGMAAKLRQMGEEVRFLGLLDTYPSEVHDWSDPTGEQANLGAEREQEQFINDAMADVMDDEFRREKEEMFGHIFENYRDSVALLSKATTPGYDGHLTLFVAGKSLLPEIDPEASWLACVGSLSIHHLAHCSHEDIVSPASLEILGPLIEALIREANLPVPAFEHPEHRRARAANDR